MGAHCERAEGSFDALGSRLAKFKVFGKASNKTVRNFLLSDLVPPAQEALELCADEVEFHHSGRCPSNSSLS